MLLAATAVAVLVAAGAALAAIVPTNNAPLIASAVSSPSAPPSAATFETVPPDGTPNAVSDSSLAGFPTNGPDYGILTTGNAEFADDPNDEGDLSQGNNGGNVRGDTDLDVSILRIDFQVPATANCLSVDFRFLSEEFPEFVGSNFNDAFIAELDNSTWTTSGSSITAPNNFAFDETGDPVSVNTAGFASAEAGNTTYDGATQLLQARTQVTPGAHSVYLSIFDQGDASYDSAVFLDNLRLFSAPDASCQEGAVPTANLSLTKSDSPDPVSVSHNVTYTLEVTNNGPENAEGVVVEDDLPAGVTFQSASSGCTHSAGTVICNVGNVGSGASVTRQIVVRADQEGTLVNEASVRADTADPNEADNSDSETTTVQSFTPYPVPEDCTIVGTAGVDNLPGTPGDDVICGLGGNDIMSGEGGKDLLRGGAGNDTANGGADSDKILGQGGKDNLDSRDGVGGNDTINGGPGTDSCLKDAGDRVKYCP